MKRVMIIGQPGSGKSTLARKLGQYTDLPVVHIDQIHWKPGWIERGAAEKTALCQEVHQRDAWIFEGGHSQSWQQRLERCDTLIWLDFPLGLRLLRVVHRTIRDYGRTRQDLPPNCPERFNLEFYKWIWKTRRRHREKMRRYLKPAIQSRTTSNCAVAARLTPI
ncbi:MAG: DNA topology modulation protein FlaR [Rhizobiaceae bacterium]